MNRVTEIFRVFLLLGLTSFGGPVAHLGYFRDAFVTRRKWLSEQAYADLLALCQFLPGPASSQVGMAVGLLRGGYAGLIAAWIAFTLPSALILVAFAYGAARYNLDAGAGWAQGLRIAAVAVVAHAVIGMARNLITDMRRAAIAVFGVALALLLPRSIGQLVVIFAGGIIGFLWLQPRQGNAPRDSFAVPVSRRTASASLTLFFMLLIILPLLAAQSANHSIGMIDSFYRVGSLVFGGGHVVLPLLQREVVDTGLINQDVFLTGYGMAQAVPGPLFSFAAYLGTIRNGITGAALALGAIYLPSLLLVIGALPFWDRLRTLPAAQCAVGGVNAAVVGLLAAALYNPVFSEGVISLAGFGLGLLCFAALLSERVPAWAVVIAAAAAGYVLL